MRHAIAMLALLVASPASADVAPHYRPWLTVNAQVVSLGTDAPREQRNRAALGAQRSAHSFVGRIERCLQDHGGAAEGPVSARLEYDRAILPSRTRVIEGRGALRACVAEVLPSIALDEVPHGRIVIEVTVDRGRWR